VSAFIPTV